MLPRASTIRTQAAELDNVPPALVRRVIRELDRLEPAIRDADGLWPRLLHGDYGNSNTAVGQADCGHLEVVAVFDFESAAPVLATSLFGDVAAALREHGSATLDEQCYYFRRSD